MHADHVFISPGARWLSAGLWCPPHPPPPPKPPALPLSLFPLSHSSPVSDNACPTSPPFLNVQTDLRELHGIFDRFLAAKEPTAATLHRLAPLLHHLVAISVLSPSAGCRVLVEHTPLDPERWRVIYGSVAIMAGSESCPAEETTAAMVAVLQRLSTSPAPATDAKTQCGMLAAEVSVVMIGLLTERLNRCDVRLRGCGSWMMRREGRWGGGSLRTAMLSANTSTSASASRRSSPLSHLRPPNLLLPTLSCFSSSAASCTGLKRGLPTWVISSTSDLHDMPRACY